MRADVAEQQHINADSFDCRTDSVNRPLGPLAGFWCSFVTSSKELR
jgi:hypothetical protein